jgi:hypothetical protein
MTRTASIMHRNTKRRKEGVVMVAHRRGGHGSGAALMHGDSGDGKGGLMAPRRTLRQGGAL